MKRYIIASVFTVLLFAGCIRDAHTYGPGITGQDDLKAALTLRVTGGNPANTGTRALGADDENEIEEIDILVFKKSNYADPDAGATFFYRAQTTRIVDSGEDDSSKKNFTVTLQKSGEYQQLVVFTNSRTAVESVLSSFDEHTTYTEAMAAMVMERAAAWNSATGSYDPLPMWGQNDFKVFTDAASASDEIGLIRSMARIDVVVDDGAQDDFSLTGVYLYNPSTKGLLAPSAANWDADGNETTAISLPSDGRASVSNFPYTSMTTAGKSLNGVIYTFEAPAATSTSSTDEPFLLVRGSWNGENDSYYRVDFHDGIAFVPLLRNFHYIVSIDNVSGRGYPNPAEAIAAGFTNLTASTQVWDSGNMGSVVWDGSSFLTVTANEYTVDRSLHASITTIKAATNYSGGWKATARMIDDADSGWFSLVNPQGDGDRAEHAIGMEIQANDTYGDARTAIVTLTAGRLKQEITVTQNYDLDLSLDVGDVEIVFSAASPAAFNLPIDWEPASRDVSLQLINASHAEGPSYGLTGYADVTFSGGNAIPATIDDNDGDPSNGGFRQLTLLPDARTLNNFVERRSILKITVDDGEGNEKVKTVLLRQFDYRIIVTGTQETYQLSTTYSFTVKANAQWTAAISGDAGQITVPVTAGQPNISGTTFSFTTGSTNGAVPVLTFSLPEQNVSAVPINITLKKLDSNCYIVNPASGQNTVNIPIRKVFDIWESDVDLNGQRAGDASAMTSGPYTTELLWQDEISLVTSVNDPVTSTGDMIDAEFKVTVNTGGKEGNAVVVLKENGVVRWNWHIWVVKNYDPDNKGHFVKTLGTKIMDRDLGATTNFKPVDADDVRSYGLLYQHGRNAPFTGSSQVNFISVSVNSKAIYDMNNVPLYEDIDGFRKTAVTTDRNLANAITNPLIFYTNSHPNAQQSWYSPDYSLISRTDFWDLPSGKTGYDPCPEGWEVPREYYLGRVPFDESEYVAGEGMDLYEYPDNNYIGYFPFSGSRERSDGNLTTNIGSVYAVWRKSAHILLYSAGFNSPSSGYPNGYAVRCAKTR